MLNWVFAEYVDKVFALIHAELCLFSVCWTWLQVQAHVEDIAINPNWKLPEDNFFGPGSRHGRHLSRSQAISSAGSPLITEFPPSVQRIVTKLNLGTWCTASISSKLNAQKSKTWHQDSWAIPENQAKLTDEVIPKLRTVTVSRLKFRLSQD